MFPYFFRGLWFQFGSGALVLVILAAGLALAQTGPSLYDTYWRAVEIAGQPVTLAGPGQEPHLVLKAAGRRVQGATGCNRFHGSFVQEGDGCRFQTLATTRMACPPPRDALEKSFLQALSDTRRLRLAEGRLELLDQSDRVLMRLTPGERPQRR